MERTKPSKFLLDAAAVALANVPTVWWPVMIVVVAVASVLIARMLLAFASTYDDIVIGSARFKRPRRRPRARR